MITEIIILVVVAAVGFASGVLVGRKNPKTVTAAVTATTAAATVAEAAVKKL